MALALPNTASERQAPRITTHISKDAPHKRVQFATLQRKALTVCIYTPVTRMRQVTSLRSLGHGDQQRRRPSRKFSALWLAAVTPVTAVERVSEYGRCLSARERFQFCDIKRHVPQTRGQRWPSSVCLPHNQACPHCSTFRL